MAKAKTAVPQVSTGNVPAAITGQGNPGIAAPVNTGNLMSALAGLTAGTAPKSAGKSKDPNVAADGVQVSAYIKALKDKKDAESRLEVAFAALAPGLEKNRIELSRKMATYHDSLDVNGCLKYIVAHRYKTIGTEVAPQLQGVFGADYGRFFTTGVEIKVNPSTFETLSQAQQVDLVNGLTALCQKLGVNPFEIKPTLRPTEALSHERVMNPGVEAIFSGASTAGLVCPIKATLREPGK